MRRVCDAGGKRAVPEDAATTRPAKTAKTSSGRAKGKAGPKVALPLSSDPFGPLLSLS